MRSRSFRCRQLSLLTLVIPPFGLPNILIVPPIICQGRARVKHDFRVMGGGEGPTPGPALKGGEKERRKGSWGTPPNSRTGEDPCQPPSWLGGWGGPPA